MADVLESLGDETVEKRVRQQVLELTANFPLYEKRLGR
jgi:glycine/serine hydroxymethyltransferase